MSLLACFHELHENDKALTSPTLAGFACWGYGAPLSLSLSLFLSLPLLCGAPMSANVYLACRCSIATASQSAQLRHCQLREQAMPGLKYTCLNQSRAKVCKVQVDVVKWM